MRQKLLTKFIKQKIKQSPPLFNFIRLVSLPLMVKEKTGDFARDQNDAVYPTLIKELKKIAKPTALEMGTKIRRGVSTHNKGAFWELNFENYTLTDIEEGEDVDIISDAHSLSKTFGENTFDLVMSVAVFEHLKYPQIASHELMKILKIGGVAYINTHQTHHLHGYPSDYYRFSRKALRSLFPPEMGVEILMDFYQNPCSIYSHHTGLETGESYINVGIVIKKTSPTPPDFFYNFDHEKN